MRWAALAVTWSWSRDGRLPGTPARLRLRLYGVFLFSKRNGAHVDVAAQNPEPPPPVRKCKGSSCTRLLLPFRLEKERCGRLVAVAALGGGGTRCTLENERPLALHQWAPPCYISPRVAQPPVSILRPISLFKRGCENIQDSVVDNILRIYVSIMFITLKQLAI